MKTCANFVSGTIVTVFICQTNIKLMILNRTKSILITLLALLQLGSANIFAGNNAVPSASDDKVVIPAPGEKTLLHSGWLARRAHEVLVDGNTLTMQSLNI